jgi:hypothetical protein
VAYDSVIIQGRVVVIYIHGGHHTHDRSII